MLAPRSEFEWVPAKYCIRFVPRLAIRIVDLIADYPYRIPDFLICLQKSRLGPSKGQIIAGQSFAFCDSKVDSIHSDGDCGCTERCQASLYRVQLSENTKKACVSRARTYIHLCIGANGNRRGMQHHPQCSITFIADPLAYFFFGESADHSWASFQHSARPLDRDLGIKKSLIPIERPRSTGNSKEGSFQFLVIEELRRHAHGHAKLNTFHLFLEVGCYRLVTFGDQEPHRQSSKINSSESLGQFCRPPELIRWISGNVGRDSCLEALTRIAGRGGQSGVPKVKCGWSHAHPRRDLRRSIM